MQKVLSVYLLATSLIVQGAEPKSRPGSAKRAALSQSDLVQGVREQEDRPLFSSAPSLSRSQSMLIPQQRKGPNDASPSSFNDLIGVGSPNLLTFTTAASVFNRKGNSFDDKIPK